MSFFDEGGAATVVDVAAVLDATWTELVVRCVELGALVSVGRSRDGGAVSLTVTSGGRYRREWLRADEEGYEFLKAAIVHLEGEPPVPPTVKATRRPR